MNNNTVNYDNMASGGRADTSRVHRVGTITAGLCLIFFGILFWFQTQIGTVSYEVIFSLWPIILIGLGMELLSSCFSMKKMIYDKGAIFLLILMTVFAMGMAVADVCIEASERYMEQYAYRSHAEIEIYDQEANAD